MFGLHGNKGRTTNTYASVQSCDRILMLQFGCIQKIHYSDVIKKMAKAHWCTKIQCT